MSVTEGRDLQEFLQEERQRQDEKEERERERQDEKEERERKRQRQDEREEREFQLEQLRIQTTAQLNVNNNTPKPRHEGDDDRYKPKIPNLEDRDDIESWFHQFEHYAEDCHLSEEKKASRLVYFLSGKARDIYSKLSREDALDYHTLKNALFEGFQLNTEEYRTQFRNTKKNATDSYKQHVIRLERYLTKWIELDHCEDSAKGLTDLMLREQVLETLPPELAIHGKDRNPLTAKEIVGKKVLLLRPLKQNKLELTLRGPYEVTEKINTFEYRIKIGAKVKVNHINLTKEYVERNEKTEVIAQPEEDEETEIGESVTVVIEEDETMNDDFFAIDAQKSIPLLEMQRTENENDIHFFEKLTAKHIQEAKESCHEKSANLTDVPMTCNLVKCQIKRNTNTKIKDTSTQLAPNIITDSHG
ncbi:glutamic acid-rich protein-like [Littorina saxatilis]|uniref:glutamic acid-rich protein-like n=1 Tax=Littorina saxatilis TaxID=31220 RepID=UPI0038B56C80